MSTTGRMAVGHPVDVASGVLFNSFTDFALSGEIPLTFERFYSTGLLNRPAGPLSQGWRHSFQHELRQTLEGFSYVDPTGAEYALDDVKGEFERTGRLLLPGSQIELRGTHDEVELRLYGSEHPHWNMRFVRQPHATHYLLQSIERNKHVKLMLGHDAKGRLIRATQLRSGRTLHLEYDKVGMLGAVKFAAQPQELVARFSYDAQGRLARVVDRVGEVSTFEYDAAHRMVSEARCSGAVYVFRYATNGRCVYAAGVNGHEARTLEYDVAGRKTRVLDSHGHVTSYEYNEVGQVTGIEMPLGGKASFTFDDLGRLVKTVGVHKLQTTQDYDELGRISAVSLPNGKKQRIEYDERHLPIRVTDQHGGVWRYDFNEDRRRVRTVDPRGREWHYRYNEFSELESIRGPLGTEDRRRWDVHGNLEVYITPEGREWRASYDAYGRRILQVDPAGGLTRRTYDKAGNLVQVEAPDGRQWRYTYDGGGRCTSVQGPDGSNSHTRYNACGQEMEVVHPDGTATRFEWDTEPGRILAIEDARGQRLEWTYDAQGRPLTRRHWDGSVIRFEWDLAANLTAVIEPTGARCEYEYDEWQHLVVRTTADGVKTRFTYDENSYPVKISAPGSEVLFERDTLGRLLAETHNGLTVRSTYDDEGRRVMLSSDLAAATRFDYTPRGLCSAIHRDEESIRFRYGPHDQEVWRELPGGAVFEQHHDRLGRLLEQVYLPPGPREPSKGSAAGSLLPPGGIRRRYGYDGVGHVAFIEDSLRGRTHFIHNVMGQLQALVHGGGEAEFFEFDPSDNRKVAARLSSADAPMLEQVLHRDARGWVRLDVDALRRLGAEVATTRVSGGNRAAEMRRGQEQWQYEYDASGCMVRKRVLRGGRSESWQYEWNALGQLAGVTRPDGERWRYEYDVLGRRVAKHGPSGTRKYVWDGLDLLHEVEPAGEVTTYIRHPEQPTPVLEHRKGATQYVLTNGLGSASERVTADGQRVWTAQRGTWGEVALDTPEGEAGFPGQTYDPESGLYYNHARYYDPLLGRYISPDPIGVLGGLNEYAYVPSPVDWTDVLGLSYISGGPYVWDPLVAHNAEGMPEIGFADNRYVRTSEGRRTVRTDTDKQRGKCLAVVDGVPQSNLPGYFKEGDMPAFVSGHGNPESSLRPPESFRVRMDHNGNWCHAEVQALTFLHANGIHGATVYVDRPACPMCQSSLQHILDTHFSDGNGGHTVRLMYRLDDGTYEPWDDHRRGKSGTTGCDHIKKC